MQEHFHFTTNKAKIQKQYNAILSIVLHSCLIPNHI
ncbi:hypothetical protein HNR31_003620 [Anoxybacillus caldiproteolyticus]|uniref:Uncharacterized protein n=1 Tax=Thermaerobacillus caldiproteolyticus TaxID=247480 RepID=A0A7V9Z9Z6_9BACL|nr:hypothetical protein [Anoxybacillus caldiproteolyticus]